jgi:hypothetical protein
MNCYKKKIMHVILLYFVTRSLPKKNERHEKEKNKLKKNTTFTTDDWSIIGTHQHSKREKCIHEIHAGIAFFRHQTPILDIHRK